MYRHDILNFLFFKTLHSCAAIYEILVDFLVFAHIKKPCY